MGYKQGMKKVKLRRARNPYVAEMRHKRSGAHKDRKKEMSRKACRKWSKHD